MVLCEGIEYAQLMELVGEISRQDDSGSVKLAVGYAWRGENELDFSQLLLKADQAMYEDKKKRREQILKML